MAPVRPVPQRRPLGRGASAALRAPGELLPRRRRQVRPGPAHGPAARLRVLRPRRVHQPRSHAALPRGRHRDAAAGGARRLSEARRARPRARIDGAAVRASLGPRARAATALYAPTYSRPRRCTSPAKRSSRRSAAAGLNVIVKLHDRSLDPDPRYQRRHRLARALRRAGARARTRNACDSWKPPTRRRCWPPPTAWSPITVRSGSNTWCSIARCSCSTRRTCPQPRGSTRRRSSSCGARPRSCTTPAELAAARRPRAPRIPPTCPPRAAEWRAGCSSIPAGPRSGPCD